ncbi:hypothetical protein ACFL4V_01590 [Candidatus Latescibacterota bacterium]
MRIVMPLFDFGYSDLKPFYFSENKLRIEEFNAQEEIPDISLFSEREVNYMKSKISWAIVFEDENTVGYKEKVNLLLLSFRILSEGKPPFIKYRLCKEDNKERTRLNDTMTYIHEFEKIFLSYSNNDLKKIDEGFKALKEMYEVSTRCHNALYFLFLSFQTIQWVSSFMFLMNTLEAISSKDESGGATKTICKRVSSFLDLYYYYKYIKKLYDIRSCIVHGKIVASDEASENLKNLACLRDIVLECMKKILNEKIYLKFKDKQTRDAYLNTLT